jgi:large subunit ribosomal protein L24
MQRIKKGDTVAVIAGKDKGVQGEVVSVLPKMDRVVVNGVNIVKRHQKARPGANGQTIQAQIVEREAALQLSNVMLVCNTCKQATRVGYRIREADGFKVRVCKKCNADIE